jgi:DNA primase
MIDVEALKASITIEQVFDWLELPWPMLGRNIPCPLHNDKDPSFHVYEETNSWYCFGCLKGGDIIDLVEAVEGIDFLMAVQRLGEWSGSPIPKGLRRDNSLDRSPEQLLPMVDDLTHDDVVKRAKRNQLTLSHIEEVFRDRDEILRQHRNKEIGANEAIRRLLEWRAHWKTRLN